VTIMDNDAAESGPNSKKNWWASAREVVRVTKGKNVLVSGGVVADADVRAPRDVATL
jgi:ribonuclease P/MRP protein subunit RPP1